MGVKDIDKGFKKLVQTFGKVDKSFTKVGIFEESTYPDGTQVAQVAFWHEFGTTKMPSRPFMRQTLKLKEDELKKVIDGQTRNLIDGKVNERRALEGIGAFYSGAMKQTITTARFAPLSPVTLELKPGKTTPLIDTGVMRTSITHKEVL